MLRRNSTPETKEGIRRRARADANEAIRKGRREASTENTLRAKVRTCATRRASKRERRARRPYRLAVRLCVSEGGCTRWETSLSVVLRGNANGTLPLSSFSFFVRRDDAGRWSFAHAWRVITNSVVLTQLCSGGRKREWRKSSHSLSPIRRCVECARARARSVCFVYKVIRDTRRKAWYERKKNNELSIARSQQRQACRSKKPKLPFT